MDVLWLEIGTLAQRSAFVQPYGKGKLRQVGAVSKVRNIRTGASSWYCYGFSNSGAFQLAFNGLSCDPVDAWHSNFPLRQLGIPVQAVNINYTLVGIQFILPENLLS